MRDGEIILPLDYREDEVVPAQRARFRGSTRLRLGLLFALVTVALLGFARRTGDSGHAGRPAALVPGLFLLACFGGVVIFAWRFAPLIDFRTNSIWKREHRLRLTPDAIFLEPPDGGQGTELPWRSLRRVLATRRAFVLVFRSEREFLIVPRRVLGAHEAEFRRRAGAGRDAAAVARRHRAPKQ
jgi:hypothetical protein